MYVILYFNVSPYSACRRSTHLQEFKFQIESWALMSGTDTSAIQMFVAAEIQLFHTHLSAAIKKFEESGELPHSLFGVKAVKALQKGSKAKGQTAKRKLTAFNIYVAEKLKKLKDKGDTRTHAEKFKSVIEGWTKLTDEQKKHYHEKYSAQIAASGEGGERVPETLGGSIEDADPSEGLPKKKKKVR